MTALTTTAGSAVTARRSRDARTYWRVVLAVVAPLGALLLGIGDLLSPVALDASAKETVAALATHQSLYNGMAWLGLILNVTMIPGAIAVGLVCRRRSPVLTAIAATIVVGGFISGFTSANNGLNLVTIAGIDKGVDQTTLATLLDVVNNNAILGVSLLPMLAAITIGRILLGIALWRSAVAPRWMAGALIAAPLVEFLNFSESNVQPAVGWMLTALGFASASVALLRMRNDEFDLPALER